MSFHPPGVAIDSVQCDQDVLAILETQQVHNVSLGDMIEVTFCYQFTDSWSGIRGRSLHQSFAHDNPAFCNPQIAAQHSGHTNITFVQLYRGSVIRNSKAVLRGAKRIIMPFAAQADVDTSAGQEWWADRQ